MPLSINIRMADMTLYTLQKLRIIRIGKQYPQKQEPRAHTNHIHIYLISSFIAPNHFPIKFCSCSEGTKRMSFPKQKAFIWSSMCSCYMITHWYILVLPNGI